VRTVYVDLVLDNGRLVRVECPGKHEDDLHDSLNNAQATGEWWTPAQFDGCTTTYLGHRLDRVNMARVVGRM
jgi:hypothetical protein